MKIKRTYRKFIMTKNKTWWKSLEIPEIWTKTNLTKVAKKVSTKIFDPRGKGERRSNRKPAIIDQKIISLFSINNQDSQMAKIKLGPQKDQDDV